MTILLGSIADTHGPSDLANTLTKNGFAPCRRSHSRSIARPCPTRCSGRFPEDPVGRSGGAVAPPCGESWLRGRGAAHVLYKICSTFDSTDSAISGR